MLQQRDIEYTISGEIAQSARLEWPPGLPVWASKGSLMAYSQRVDWHLKIPGGVSGAVRRSLSGEGLGLVLVQADAPEQYVLLAAGAPGKITAWDGEDEQMLGSTEETWRHSLTVSITTSRALAAARRSSSAGNACF